MDFKFFFATFSASREEKESWRPPELFGGFLFPCASVVRLPIFLNYPGSVPNYPEENGIAGVTAQDDVVEGAGIVDLGFAGHGP